MKPTQHGLCTCTRWCLSSPRHGTRDALAACPGLRARSGAHRRPGCSKSNDGASVRKQDCAAHLPGGGHRVRHGEPLHRCLHRKADGYRHQDSHQHGILRHHTAQDGGGGCAINFSAQSNHQREGERKTGFAEHRQNASVRATGMAFGKAAHTWYAYCRGSSHTFCERRHIVEKSQGRAE